MRKLFEGLDCFHGLWLAVLELFEGFSGLFPGFCIIFTKGLGMLRSYMRFRGLPQKCTLLALGVVP